MGGKKRRKPVSQERGGWGWRKKGKEGGREKEINQRNKCGVVCTFVYKQLISMDKPSQLTVIVKTSPRFYRLLS